MLWWLIRPQAAIDNERTSGNSSHFGFLQNPGKGKVSPKSVVHDVDLLSAKKRPKKLGRSCSRVQYEWNSNSSILSHRHVYSGVGHGGVLFRLRRSSKIPHGQIPHDYHSQIILGNTGQTLGRTSVPFGRICLGAIAPLILYRHCIWQLECYFHLRVSMDRCTNVSILVSPHHWSVCLCHLHHFVVLGSHGITRIDHCRDHCSVQSLSVR